MTGSQPLPSAQAMPMQAGGASDDSDQLDQWFAASAIISVICTGDALASR